jgi:hypothetical protein
MRFRLLITKRPSSKSWDGLSMIYNILICLSTSTRKV